MNIQDQETMTANEMILALIKERNLTLTQFCALVGKKPPNVSNQLRGNYMTAKKWREYAKALGYKVVMIPDDPQ